MLDHLWENLDVSNVCPFFKPLLVDVSKRAKLFCEEVIADSEKYNINDVVIVAHGVTVRALTQSRL